MDSISLLLLLHMISILHPLPPHLHRSRPPHFPHQAQHKRILLLIFARKMTYLSTLMEKTYQKRLLYNNNAFWNIMRKVNPPFILFNSLLLNPHKGAPIPSSPLPTPQRPATTESPRKSHPSSRVSGISLNSHTLNISLQCSLSIVHTLINVAVPFALPTYEKPQLFLSPPSASITHVDKVQVMEGC